MKAIHTELAPLPIGCYSQAIKIGQLLFLSGQIGLDPISGNLQNGIEAQLNQVFNNMESIIKEADGSWLQVAKLTIYLTDLTNFSLVNDIMSKHFQKPYPARSTIGVSSLPKGALVEIEAIVALS